MYHKSKINYTRSMYTKLQAISKISNNSKENN